MLSHFVDDAVLAIANRPVGSVGQRKGHGLDGDGTGDAGFLVIHMREVMTQDV